MASTYIQHTTLTAAAIPQLMGSTTLRLRALLTPLCPCLGKDESPSIADIAAATATLEQCTDLLLELEVRTGKRDMKQAPWPNYDQWFAFSKSITSIVDSAKPKDHATKSNTERGAAIEALNAAVIHIKNTVLRLRKKSRMSFDDGKGLFASVSVRILLGEVAGELYSRFIDNQQLKHKEVMVRLATIYEVLRRQAGVGKVFYGPDFDDLFITTLGIRYNSSQNRRGRYRSVEDAYNRLFRDSDDGLHSDIFRRMLHDADRQLSGDRGGLEDAQVPFTQMGKK